MQQSVRHSIAIAMTLDDRYVPPACVTIGSIGRNAGCLQRVTLLIVSTGLSGPSMEVLARASQQAGMPIEFRTVTDVSQLGAIPGWAVPACLRLFVGEMCEGFDRALFLDADVLVLEDMRPLLDFDLAGKSAAAVVHFPPLSVMRVAVPRSRRGDADPAGPYFNAGVVLFDVPRWMNQAVGVRSRAFLSRFPATRILDQDAWNVVLSGDWCQLEREWNVPAGPVGEAPMLRGLAQVNPGILDELEQWRLAQQRAKILHFVGQPKPWEARYPWPELAELYRSFVQPEYGADWPSYQERLIATDNNEQRTREFIRQ